MHRDRADCASVPLARQKCRIPPSKSRHHARHRLLSGSSKRSEGLVLPRVVCSTACKLRLRRGGGHAQEHRCCLGSCGWHRREAPRSASPLDRLNLLSEPRSSLPTFIGDNDCPSVGVGLCKADVDQKISKLTHVEAQVVLVERHGARKVDI